MILVFGSINVDLVTRAPAIPRPGQTVLAPRYDRWFGGKGANQAVAAARARLDPAMPVVMVGATGDDAFGRDARDNLRACGVETGGIAHSTLPTGCAFITVDAAGENAITVASGANQAVRADQVDDAMLRSAAWLVLQMELPVPEVLALAGRAAALGTKVLLNLAPMAIDRTALDALLHTTDILVVNEHEAAAAHALLRDPPARVSETLAGAELARRYRLTLVATLGPRGAVAFLADGQRLTVAAPRVEAVDTTGAGDTFVGILAASLAGSLGLGPATARACRGAALACLHAGAQTGMPGAADLDGDGTGMDTPPAVRQ